MLQTYHFRALRIASIFILTASNIILTIRLLQSCTRSDSDPMQQIPKAPQLTSTACVEYGAVEDHQTSLPAFFNINFDVGRWDTRRLYKFFDFAVIGENYDLLSRTFTVCLATQSSLERLHSFVQVVQHWNGPVSVAVFAAGDEEFEILQLYITYLRYCFTSVRNNVSFHLAVPKDRLPQRKKSTFKNWNSYKCSAPEATLKELLKLRSPDTIRWRLRNAYPQNHMRNLARKGCQSAYVFLTDVDIVPSINITSNLDKFLRSAKCSKLCAYVIPTYEIDTRVKYPNSKNELIRLVKKGLARPFHEKVFIYNQFATNFSKWENIHALTNETHVSHNVTNFEFLYEPFYVALDSAPEHDERFLGYGFTRNSQVYEMFVAGYQFQVISPLFTCHWGLQQKKSRPAWREQQNNINRKHFESFKKEILARYKKDPLKMFASKKRI